MIEVMCTVRSYDPNTDTASVEIQGLGIIDTWIDGVKVAQQINRGLLIYGGAGVLSMPDLHRICEASLIQVVPPGSLVVSATKTYTGHDHLQTNGSGAGSVTVTFPVAFTGQPTVYALADALLTMTITGVSTTQFTANVTGAPANSFTFVSWSATGPA